MILNVKLVLKKKEKKNIGVLHGMRQYLRDTNPLDWRMNISPFLYCHVPLHSCRPGAGPVANPKPGWALGAAWPGHGPVFWRERLNSARRHPFCPSRQKTKLRPRKARTPLPRPLINAEHGFHYTDCSILLLTRHKSLR